VGLFIRTSASRRKVAGNPLLKFIGTFLRIALARSISGGESTTRTELEHDEPSGQAFKMLGEYDVARFSVTRENLSERALSPSSNTLLCKELLLPICCTEKEGRPERIEQHLRSVISDFPVVAITFFMLNGASGRREAHCLCAELLDEANSSDCKHAALMTGEAFEVAVITGSHRIEHAFSKITEWRNRYGNKLADTETRFFISYPKWIDVHNQGSSATLGKCRASISCFVAPGDENILSKLFDGNHYKTWVTSGKADVLISTRHEMPVEQLLVDLLSIRTNSKDSARIYRTHTQLMFGLENTQNPVTKVKKNYLRSKRVTPPLDSLRKCITELTDPKIKQHLGANATGRLVETLCRIYASAENPLFEKRLSVLWPILDSRLPHCIDAFIKTFPNPEGKEFGNTRKTLTVLATYLYSEFASAQSRGGIFGVAGRYPDPYFGGGAASLEAINLLVMSMYRNFTQCSTNAATWSGFVTQQPYAPFELKRAGIYLGPSEIVFPFHPDGRSWTTLTHEFSHDVYKQATTNGKSWKSLVESSLSSGQAQSVATKETIWEFFAHWFDFVHFYQRNFELFSRAIWTSWLANPATYVFGNLGDLVSRTLAIKLVSEGILGTEKQVDVTRLFETINSSYAELLTYLQEINPTHKAIFESLELNNEAKLYATRAVHSLSSAFRYFEKHFVVREFLRRNDWRLAEIDVSAKSIEMGVSLENASNPISLLIFFQNQILTHGRHPSVATQLALRESIAASGYPPDSTQTMVISRSRDDDSKAISDKIEAWIHYIAPSIYVETIEIDEDNAYLASNFQQKSSALKANYSYRFPFGFENDFRWVHVGADLASNGNTTKISILGEQRDTLTSLSSRESFPLHWIGKDFFTAAEAMALNRLTPLEAVPTSRRSQHLSLPIAVFSIHGLNTKGAWQDRLAEELRQHGISAVAFKYGVIRASVLRPKSRESITKRLSHELREFCLKYPAREYRRVLVAHSFGTWLAGVAFQNNQQNFPERIVFAGSIAQADLSKYPTLDKSVENVFNLCVRGDRWVNFGGPALASLTKVIGLGNGCNFGRSGSEGFHGATQDNSGQMTTLNLDENIELHLQKEGSSTAPKRIVNVKSSKEDHSLFLRPHALGDLIKVIKLNC
jgi:hypothetical protein